MCYTYSMKKSLLISLSILVGALILSPLWVLAQTASNTRQEIQDLNSQINKKKGTIEALEKSIEKVKKDIAAKQLESKSLKNQLAILDGHIEEVELDIAVTEEKLSSLTLEIESLGLSITDKQTTIDRQKVIIAELIRSLSYQSEKNYVEIMAAYDTFSDFYNQVQYIEKMERDLGKSAKAIRLAKEDLEDKKSQTEERQATYKKLQAELVEKKVDLNEQMGHKEIVLAQTQSSERTYSTLLGTLRKQYQQIENEISSIEQQVRKKLTEQEQLERLNGSDPTVMSWPTQSHYITAYFYDPDYPYRYVFEHNAVDIRAPQGSVIKAAASGYIGRAKRCTTSTCYSYVMIIHSGGISTVYGHLSKISVEEEQFVARGDIIGYSGGTPGTVGAGPFVTGPHLHFEVRKDGIPVNPLNYLVQ